MHLNEVLNNSIVKGALSGVVAAALVDIAAFRQWKNFHDAATYGWGTAAFRWFQGAVSGALTAAGIGAIS